MTEEDALGIVKRLKYEYYPKGTAVRHALDKSNRLGFILCGKLACSFP